jgi:hypothetical protein
MEWERIANGLLLYRIVHIYIQNIYSYISVESTVCVKSNENMLCEQV